MKFIKGEGFLTITNLGINHQEDISEITMKEFLLNVLECLNNYLLYHKLYLKEIEIYEKMGFLEELQTSEIDDKEIKEALEKRNILLNNFKKINA